MKRTGFLLGLGLLGLGVSGCAGITYSDAVQARDVTQSDETEMTTRVLARAEEWRNSGVTVRKGSTYKITARGRWTIGPACNWTGPDGVGAYGPLCWGDLLQLRPVKSVTLAALIGKIGEKGEPFPVLDELEFTAAEDGVLFFRINDGAGFFFDNDGSVQVRTALVRSGAGRAAGPPPPTQPADGAVSITVSHPPQDSRVSNTSIMVVGTISAAALVADIHILVNGKPTPSKPSVEAKDAPTIAFSHPIPLEPGENVIAINARDRAGSLGQRVVRVFRETAAASAVTAAQLSAGSGFVLRNTNLVLTNYHVVQGKAEIRLSFPSGEQYQGRVVMADRSNDLALVEVTGQSAFPGGLVLAMNAELKVGETVHALGYPLGAGLSRKPSMVSGSISSTLGVGDDIARFRTTAPINPGNSGGPIVNERGQVIGIAAAGLVRQEVEAIRFGIKVSAAALLLQQAQVATAFDIAVAPGGPPRRSAAEIFEDVSPHVVLIEVR